MSVLPRRAASASDAYCRGASRSSAEARAIGDCPMSSATCASAAAAPGLPSSAAANAGANVWKPAAGCPYQRCIACADHWASFSR